MGTCSNGVIELFLSVCSEFENLCKEITSIRKVKKKDGTGNRNAKISDFSKSYFYGGKAKVNIDDIIVGLRNTNIEYKPFAGWGDDPYTMPWWTSYNHVKHDRTKKYCEGNLENLLKAMAALYFMECYQYWIISCSNSGKEGTMLSDRPPDASELFYLRGFDVTRVILSSELHAVTVS